MVRATRRTFVNARADSPRRIDGGFDQSATFATQIHHSLEVCSREQRIEPVLKLQLPRAARLLHGNGARLTRSRNARGSFTLAGSPPAPETSTGGNCHVDVQAVEQRPPTAERGSGSRAASVQRHGRRGCPKVPTSTRVYGRRSAAGRAGKRARARARAMCTKPSSNGWRSDSSAERRKLGELIQEEHAVDAPS